MIHVVVVRQLKHANERKHFFKTGKTFDILRLLPQTAITSFTLRVLGMAKIS